MSPVYLIFAVNASFWIEIRFKNKDGALIYLRKPISFSAGLTIHSLNIFNLPGICTSTCSGIYYLKSVNGHHLVNINDILSFTRIRLTQELSLLRNYTLMSW